MTRLFFTIVFALVPFLGIAQQELQSLLDSLETASPQQQVNLFKKIGFLYQKLEAHKKAVAYFQEAYQQEKKLGFPLNEQMVTLKSIAFSYEQGQSTAQAIEVYQQLLSLHKQQGEKAAEIAIHRKLSALFESRQAYDDAIFHAQQLESEVMQSGHANEQVNILNNLGYLFKVNGNLENADEYYQRAFELASQSVALTNEERATMGINQGVILTSQKNYREAEDSYLEALQNFQRAENSAKQAEALNFLAANSLISNKTNDALTYINQAVALAESQNAKAELADAYLILSEIHQFDKNFEESKKYYQLHQELKEQLEAEDRIRQQAYLEQEMEVERRESQIKSLIAEQREQEMALRQSELEREKKEKELELLKQQQNLQEAQIKAEQLEKERVRQTLALTQQKLEAERRQQQIEVLEQEQEIKELALRQKELQEKERQRAIELLETEKKLQAQQLDAEERTRKYFVGAFIVFALFFLFILYSLYMRSKSNRLLKQQQNEIQSKNEELQASEEELRQNMEELRSTQEAMEVQNVELAAKNRTVTESIQAAQTIQTAILPSATQRNALFPQNFTIYRPKDIVSGDFFWLHGTQHEKIVAVVDCTGHGVPGAFMSLVGADSLSEIIELREINDPAFILTELNRTVRNKLNQKEGLSDEGMDLAICKFEKLEDNHVKMTFAGAKGKMFIVYTDSMLEELKGDRKAIGGKHNKDDIEFTNQEKVLPPETMLYFLTDGYIDQADKQRRRFSSKRFKNLLLKIHLLSLEEQKTKLEAALDKHQGKEHQRDDITVMGIRI